MDRHFFTDIVRALAHGGFERDFDLARRVSKEDAELVACQAVGGFGRTQGSRNDFERRRTNDLEI